MMYKGGGFSLQVTDVAGVLHQLSLRMCSAGEASLWTLFAHGLTLSLSFSLQCHSHFICVCGWAGNGKCLTQYRGGGLSLACVCVCVSTICITPHHGACCQKKIRIAARSIFPHPLHFGLGKCMCIYTYLLVCLLVIHQPAVPLQKDLTARTY